MRVLARRPPRATGLVIAAILLLASAVPASLLKYRVFPEHLAWSAAEAAGLAVRFYNSMWASVGTMDNLEPVLNETAFRDANRGRDVTAAELLEVSLVSLPSNPRALVR